jgi:type IV secretion system protein VirB10
MMVGQIKGASMAKCARVKPKWLMAASYVAGFRDKLQHHTTGRNCKVIMHQVCTHALTEKRGSPMRMWLSCLLLSAACLAQVNTGSLASKPPRGQSEATDTLTIPAGTKIPLALKQTISTKTARAGDAVYAETTFPFVLNDRVLVPAGTYVQGRISEVRRGGRVHGRAELLMHFTSLIFPSGYTVILPGSVENVPGGDKTSVKDQEGTIRSDSQTGEKVGRVAETTGTGAVIGGLSHGAKGAGIGAGIGGAVGAAIALLSRGSDVRLEPGTGIEMVIQRPVTFDATRVSVAGR